MEEYDKDSYISLNDENMDNNKKISNKAKRKAVLYYLISYTYKFNEKLKYPNEKYDKIKVWVNKCLDE